MAAASRHPDRDEEDSGDEASGNSDDESLDVEGSDEEGEGGDEDELPNKGNTDGGANGQKAARGKIMKKRKTLKAERDRVGGKRGVCYLSRIPPHLKPLKLRHILSQYGEVLRIYLAPEDPAIRWRRKKAGGNSGKNFTEGWVEFAKKSVAKRVAAMLNGEPMGGGRRSAYYYDLWNIKYLRKFKWDHLTEEIAYRKAVHDQRMEAELSAAKRQRDFYLSRVDQSRAIDSMEVRKRKRQEEEGGEEKADAGDGEGERKSASRIVRHFPQRKSLARENEDKKRRVAPDVLAAVFGAPKAARTSSEEHARGGQKTPK